MHQVMLCQVAVSLGCPCAKWIDCLYQAKRYPCCESLDSSNWLGLLELNAVVQGWE